MEYFFTALSAASRLGDKTVVKKLLQWKNATDNEGDIYSIVILFSH